MNFSIWAPVALQRPKNRFAPHQKPISSLNFGPTQNFTLGFFIHKKLRKSEGLTFWILVPTGSLEIGPQRNSGRCLKFDTPLERAQRAESSPLKPGFLRQPEIGEKPVWKILLQKELPTYVLSLFIWMSYMNKFKKYVCLNFREFFALVQNGVNRFSKFVKPATLKMLQPFSVKTRVIFFGPKFQTVFHQFPVSLKIHVLVGSTRLVELFPTVYHTWGISQYFVGVRFSTRPLGQN